MSYMPRPRILGPAPCGWCGELVHSNAAWSLHSHGLCLGLAPMPEGLNKFEQGEWYRRQKELARQTRERLAAPAE